MCSVFPLRRVLWAKEDGTSRDGRADILFRKVRIMFQMFRRPMGLTKPPFRVYLCSKESISYPAPIRRRIQDHFRTIVAKSGKFSRVEVAWSSVAPKLNQHELVVFFVGSKNQSVAKKLWASVTFGDDGTTVVGDKGDVVSEVYLDGSQDDPYGLANVAMHELMHNVAMMTNELHNLSGLRMGLDPVTAHTPLVTGDVDLMVKHLTRFRTQWTAGF